MRLNFDPAKRYQDIVERYELLEKINQNISLMVYILDIGSLDAKFTTTETYRILGVEEDILQTFSYREMAQLFHHEDYPKFITQLQQTKKIEDNDVLQNDLRLVRSNGELIWLQNKTLVFERDIKGKVCKILGIAEDITERINFINTLQERNKQLEDIAWTNAHEIRRPVASIMGLVHLFDRENLQNPLNAEIFTYLDKALKELDVVIGNIVIKATEHRQKP